MCLRYWALKDPLQVSRGKPDTVGGRPQTMRGMQRGDEKILGHTEREPAPVRSQVREIYSRLEPFGSQDGPRTSMREVALREPDGVPGEGDERGSARLAAKPGAVPQRHETGEGESSRTR